MSGRCVSLSTELEDSAAKRIAELEAKNKELKKRFGENVRFIGKADFGAFSQACKDSE